MKRGIHEPRNDRGGTEQSNAKQTRERNRQEQKKDIKPAAQRVSGYLTPIKTTSVVVMCIVNAGVNTCKRVVEIQESEIHGRWTSS